MVAHIYAMLPRAIPKNRLSFTPVCALLLLLYGCANAGREIGESKLNDFVGKSVNGTYLETSPNVERIESGAMTRYLQKSQYGCEIEFEVDTRSKRVTSWKYISSPSLCWSSKGSY